MFGLISNCKLYCELFLFIALALFTMPQTPTYIIGCKISTLDFAAMCCWIVDCAGFIIKKNKSKTKLHKQS